MLTEDVFDAVEDVARVLEAEGEELERLDADEADDPDEVEELEDDDPEEALELPELLDEEGNPVGWQQSRLVVRSGNPR
jgi:hypothetical protein